MSYVRVKVDTAARGRRGLTAAVVLASWLAGSIHAAAIDVIYVDGSATGPVHDGTSWCSAFVDLADALTKEDYDAGQEIRVADGVYAPAGPNGDRSLSFVPPTDVVLIGGFAGCGASSPDERDLGGHAGSPSILSGDLNGNDGSEASTYAENSLWVVTLNNRCTIDGFTVSGGNANGKVSNISDSGGGLHVWWGAQGSTIRNCHISGNQAYYGAGTFLRTTVLFDNCTFLRNVCLARSGVVGKGGGAYVWQNSTEFRACSFTANTAGRGGALLISSASPMVVESTFRSNSATDGGAVFCVNGGTPSFVRCILQGNRADPGGGGAVFCDGYNSALRPRFDNCLISQNRAVWGAGIYTAADVRLEIAHCTIAHNTASMEAGGVRSSRAYESFIENSILYFNRDAHGRTLEAQIAGSIPVSYSCVQGVKNGEDGNISDDPLFGVAPGGVTWRLTANSPAIDAADPGFVPPVDVSSLGDFPRMVCGRTDMGAYEYQRKGDGNCDGEVNIYDLQAFGECLSGPAEHTYSANCRAFDYDGDLDVDLLDSRIVMRVLTP